MSSAIEIPGNVWEFIDKASEDVGRIEAELFSQNMHGLLTSMRVTSPIEQMFVVALHAMAKAYWVEINPDPLEVGDKCFYGTGVHLRSQVPVGRYRVDFYATRAWFADGGNCFSGVIVELDGHDFHDRDKRQRSYEKARDRHFARLGLKVLHYTGSDVVRDPYRVVHEVLDTIECFGPCGSQPYNEADPLAGGY